MNALSPTNQGFDTLGIQDEKMINENSNSYPQERMLVYHDNEK